MVRLIHTVVCIGWCVICPFFEFLDSVCHLHVLTTEAPITALHVEFVQPDYTMCIDVHMCDDDEGIQISHEEQNDDIPVGKVVDEVNSTTSLSLPLNIV
jgi:hypothetical protein